MKPGFLVILFFLVTGLAKLSAQQPRLIQPVGHTSGIDMLTYSPDGKYIVTASRSGDDRIARVWETASGKLIHNLDQHTNKISGIVYSPDGKYIVVHAAAPYLWEAATGKLLRLVDSVVVTGIFFTPDSKQLIYCKKDVAGIFSWELSSRRSKQLVSTDQSLDDIYLDSLGTKLVGYRYFSTNSEDSSSVELWDLDKGRKLFAFDCARGTVNKMTFSHNQQWLVVNTSNGIYLRNLQTGQNETVSDYEWTDTDLACFTADDRWLVFTAKHSVYVWDLFARKLVYELNEQEAWVAGMIISSDDSKIISMDVNGQLTVWTTHNGEKKLEGRIHSSANGIALSPDGKKFASFSHDNTAQLFNTDDLSWTRSFVGAGSGINKVQFSPDSSKLVSIDNNYRIRVTDVATGKLLHSLAGHHQEIYEMYVTGGGKIVTTGYDSTLRIWDLETGRQLHSIKATSFHFYKTAVHPSGESLVTWEALDDKLSFWDMNSGKLKKMQVLKSTGGTAAAMIYSKDGKYLFNNVAGNVQVRNGETGDLLKTLTGLDPDITAMAVSSDGKWLGAVADSILLVWDIQSGKRLMGRKGISPSYYDTSSLVAPSFNSIAFSPDNRRVVVAADDATAKIFDLQAGKQVLMLDSVHYLRLANSFYTVDGKMIMTIGREGYIVKWDAVAGKPIDAIGSYAEDIASADVDPGNKYVVIAMGNALNLHDINSGKLLYKTVFVNTQDWLIVDSADHFDGTEPARKLLYFICNQEVIELEQVKDQLWVPDLAGRIIRGETINSKTSKDLDICGLTPMVDDHSGSAGYHFIITPRRGGLGETVLLVNGIEVKRYAASQLVKNGDNYELKLAKQEINEMLMGGQINAVSIKAFTEGNGLSSRGLIITEDKSKAPPTPPNLFAVMVGVSDYKGDELDLKYAAKDATDISNAVSAAAKKLLNTDGKEHVFMYNLTTAKERYLLPEKISIKKTLEEIGKKATANDILLVFFAGHGVMNGEAAEKQFYFLTADASTLSATAAVKDVGISTAELVEWIRPQQIKAQKRILIFDACNSGQAINDIAGKELTVRNDDKAQQIKAIDKLNEKSGLFILSASASDQSAYEMGRYAQGILTYSLLKAIRQQPDVLEDGKYLNVSRWFSAAEKTVTELARENGARQEPQIVTNTNFNIGLVDEEVISKIILPKEKPLFAASNFQNNDESVADDDLELSKQINLQLNELATRGTDSRIVYVTATNAPDAYTLSGRYNMKGNELTVSVNIRQNKQVKTKFEVTGTSDKLPELAAAIAVKAAGLVK